MLCKLLAQAVSLTNKEGNTALILPELSALINKSLWVKLFRVVPVLRIIHYPGHIGIDVGTSRQGVAVELYFLCGCVGSFID